MNTSEQDRNQAQETAAEETVRPGTEPTPDAEDVTAAEATDTVEDDAPEGKLKGADRKRLKKAEAELESANKKLTATEAALAEEKDKYLRMLAEYDNFRRRTTKEKEGIYADAYADAVKTILPVIDNLERAAASIAPEEAESGMAKGVTLTLKAARDALTKMGVTEVETQTFDANFHNAVMHVDDESLGEGEIVEVFQKGYVKGDKVIRYAMVKVAN